MLTVLSNAWLEPEHDNRIEKEIVPYVSRIVRQRGKYLQWIFEISKRATRVRGVFREDNSNHEDY